ncbi:MAG: hypothetical protein ACO1SV_08135 [Fimbriimonas sp.]
MTIVIQLPTEVGERARQEAERRSLPVEEYVADLVTQTVSRPVEAQRVHDLLSSLDEIGDEADHRETYGALQTAEAESGLSVRRRL